jgi:hypothetical protein
VDETPITLAEGYTELVRYLDKARMAGHSGHQKGIAKCLSALRWMLTNEQVVRVGQRLAADAAVIETMAQLDEHFPGTKVTRVAL